VQDGANYTHVLNVVTPALDFDGELTVPVTVNDGASDSAVFIVRVTVTPENDQPRIIGQSTLTIPEDVPLEILLADISVFDPDNVADDFTLVLEDGLNYTRDDNTITPLENFNGQLSVAATVDDGLLTSDVFLLVVTVTPENDIPIVDLPIGSQDAVENSPFSLNISASFSDADIGDDLVFTAAGLPLSNNIVLNPQTGNFSGTPRFVDTDPAIYDIVVTATDETGAFITDEFQLTITALDRANVSLDISVAPDPGMVGDQLSWTFAARNPLGPQTATNVQLNGSFAGAGLAIVESGGSTCTIAPESAGMTDFQCMMGTLPRAGSTTIVLNTTTSAAGDVFVFATAATIDPIPIDSNPADNSEQIAVGVAQVFSNGVLQVLGNFTIQSVAAGDLNGDGMADLVVGTGAGQPIQVYLSGGFRDFVLPPINLDDTSANEGVALADFDGNGTLDLAVANGSGAADRVYSNDGAGNFLPMATLGATFSQGIAVGDFDNDGMMDVAIATIQGNPVYLGNGSGGFALHATLGTANSHAVAVGQFDNNGRADLVFANVGSDSRVWTKNAGAGFTSRDLLAIGDATSVTVGEFGGDVTQDVAFGRTSNGSGDVPANPVLTNDGSGRFGNPVALLGAAPTNDIHAGDVNGDSMIDLVFINESGVHQIWLGTGSGYNLHSEQIVDSDSRVGVLADLGLTDVGDPGGVDLAMGGAASAGVGVFLNDGFGNLGKGDAVVPVLTLVGDGTLNIPSGSPYTDAGATAEDNIDGDIDARVVVTNPVDIATVGTYTVTYDVADNAGNQATQISRTVIVQPATGTGGGGGGSVDPFILMFLMLAASLVAAQTRHQIILVGGQHNKQ